MASYKPHIGGVALKKQYGQHFLRDQKVVDEMLSAVQLDETTSVFEIGCGDGFLTRAILEYAIQRLWVFEIDPEWATVVRAAVSDERLMIFEEDILSVDVKSRLAPHAPWTLLANLPYQITFPLLHLLQQNRTLVREGVIMIQEEVAQKLTKTGGRDYGWSTLFFQHFFNFTLLMKIPPTAFYPPPRINSRLVHFVPRTDAPVIPDEERFWKFLKCCFVFPRRTLRNNLTAAPSFWNIPATTLWDHLRAQQMNMADFLALWDLVRKEGP